MIVVIGVALIVSGLLLALAVFALLEEHLRRSREQMDSRLRHIHGDLASLRKEMTNMAAITATMLDQLLSIAEQLLAADPDDKATIAALQAQVQTLTADVADFNDPARAARLQAFLDAAGAATPPPPAE